MSSWNKILVIGDMHFRPSRGYTDIIEDRREAEEKEVLDFIVEQSKDCDVIVQVGDALHSKNNTSEVVKKFTNFIERFENKKLFISVGNHEKFGDGTSALDYLKEIKNKNWNIYSNEAGQWEDLLFLPYFSKVELGCATPQETTEKIMGMVNASDAKVMFCHISISGSNTEGGTMTDLFDEAVLPRKELSKKFEAVFGGHIHKPQLDKNVVVTGSCFNDEVGELRKYVWKVDQNYKIEQIPLPGRSIYKFENPTWQELTMVPPTNTIVKAILTQKYNDEDLEKIKEQLRKFDAFSLVEQYPKERRKLAQLNDNTSVLDLDMPSLLGIYAEQNKVDFNQLKKGWDLVQSL